MKSKLSLITSSRTVWDLPRSLRQRSPYPVAAILWSKKPSRLMPIVCSQAWCSELPSNVSMQVSEPPRRDTTLSNSHAAEAPSQLPISRHFIGAAVMESENHRDQSGMFGEK